MRSTRAFRPSSLGLLIAGLVAALATIALPNVAAAKAAAPRRTAAGQTKMLAESTPPNVGALLESFRRLPGFEARFEEEKTLALLAAPLVSRGRLYFSPPATLLRRVESPNPQDILVREHVVRIATPSSAPTEDGSATAPAEVETIDLARRDEIRPLVESMLWIFAGDRERLERAYAIDYRVAGSGAVRRWRLRLVPRDARLSRLIRELVIEGRGSGAESYSVIESGGDRSTTRLFEANPARRFAAGELEALFDRGRR